MLVSQLTRFDKGMRTFTGSLICFGKTFVTREKFVFESKEPKHVLFQDFLN